MKLTLVELHIINKALHDLLEYELPTSFVFKLIDIRKKVSLPLQTAVEAINKKIDEGVSEEEANNELITEEVTIDIEKIRSTDLPKEVKGSIIQDLISIIEIVEED